MTAMIKYLTTISAFHEPEPQFSGHVCERINNGDGLTPEETQLKINQINRDIDKNGNYVETSLWFIKSYVDVVLKNFDNVNCIYLHRNPMDTFFSFILQLRGKVKTNMHLQSHWKKNLLQTTVQLDRYTNILWEWMEVRERFYYYKNRFNKTYDFDFANINNINEWLKMFTHFGIKLKPEFADSEYWKKNPYVPEGLRKLSSKTHTKQMAMGLKNFSYNEITKFVRANLDKYEDT
jgi:hypothetical protein